MESIDFNNWNGLKTYLRRYSELALERKEQLIFRGQSNAEWTLATTLDRKCTFVSDDKRLAFLKNLLLNFRQTASGITDSLPSWKPTDDRCHTMWELLARHHRVPTTVLDWTQSPWIAAYFAYADDLSRESDQACIYCLDRELFKEQTIDEIELIEDVGLLLNNQRAIEQKSIFMRVKQLVKPVAEYFEKRLFKFNIPSKDRSYALSDLDDMGINHRNLFRDLDGAAITATMRGFKYDT